MPAPKSPFETVRGAFAELDASEKTAFVLEATFAAVAEGIAETGRRFSAAVQDIDDLFTPPPPERAAAPKAAPRKKPTSKTTTSAKTAASRKPPKGGKTAGRAQKPTDDA